MTELEQKVSELHTANGALGYSNALLEIKAKALEESLHKAVESREQWKSVCYFLIVITVVTLLAAFVWG